MASRFKRGRRFCFEVHIYVVMRQGSSPISRRDVIMEELYVRKKLGPLCCGCILMNNLRRGSDPTFCFHREG